ncbi:AraC family transcriptional regulator [candidate division KSB1 bacterium]|nr:AraC family transcriptional regulator [candidate division KSB1 bacterium]
MNTVFLLLILGAMQGFFLMVLLARKQGNRKGNRILALLMLVYSLYLLESAFFQIPYTPFLPVVMTIGIGLVFLFGPLHYIYAQFIINPYYKFRLIHWLHFFPFILVKIYFYAGFLKSGVSMRQFSDNPDLYYNPFLLNLINLTKIFIGITYMIFTLLLLKKYARRIREQFSAIDKISLNWLRNITFLTLAVWLIALFTNFNPLMNGLNLIYRDYIIISIALTVLIYTMGYLGLVKPEIFSYVESIKKQSPQETKEDIILNTSSAKYAKTRLQEDKAEFYLHKLQNLMRAEKPYIRPNITLKDLAQKLNIPEYHLSQIINEKLGQNFFNFINSYRVEEVKQRMSDPRYAHISLLGIAFDSGFNSKSSFNSIFKRFTQMTPSEYAGQQKQVA